MTDVSATRGQSKGRGTNQAERGSVAFKRAFVAAPMSGFESDEDYRLTRASILSLIEHMTRHHGFVSAYYAGSHIQTQSDFTKSSPALEQDMEALEASDLFVLVYPRRILSSVLIEAGFAIARRIPLLILVRDRADLPFLLKEAERHQGSARLPRMVIRESGDSVDLRRDFDDGLRALL